MSLGAFERELVGFRKKISRLVSKSYDFFSLKCAIHEAIHHGLGPVVRTRTHYTRNLTYVSRSINEPHKRTPPQSSF